MISIAIIRRAYRLDSEFCGKPARMLTDHSGTVRMSAVLKAIKSQPRAPRIKQVPREPVMAETVADALRQGIIAGDFPPGSRMRQEDLAEQLDVSRGPVRQALMILKREGLIIAHRWKGAIVAPLDVPLIRDLYEFRGAVERFVAETLATRSNFDPEPVRALVAAGTAAAKARDIPRLIELDLRFHTRLYEAVGNRVLLDVMSGHWTHTRRVMAATLKLSGYPQTAWQEHAAILDAIQVHDPKLAGQRAAAHMAAASMRMVDTFTRELERLQSESAEGEQPRHRRSRAGRTSQRGEPKASGHSKASGPSKANS